MGGEWEEKDLPPNAAFLLANVLKHHISQRHAPYLPRFFMVYEEKRLFSYLLLYLCSVASKMGYRGKV